jgi:hypothetical protein
MAWNGLPKFSLLKMGRKGIGKEFQGFIIENGLEWNGFSLPRNGSERNSEVFLFRETDGIPTELPSVPSCFVFCGIIFLSENGNPSGHVHIFFMSAVATSQLDGKVSETKNLALFHKCCSSTAHSQRNFFGSP